MTRKIFTKDFKLDAIGLVIDQGYSCAEAARSLGMSDKTLNKWVNESKNKGEDAFPGNGKLTDEQAEIRKLREEVRRLQMEKEILKKATAFFAKEMK